MEKTTTKSILPRIGKYMLLHKSLLFCGLLCVVLGSGMATVVPMLFARAIDCITVSGSTVVVDMQAIISYMWTILALAVTSSLLIWLANVLLSKLSFVVVRDIRTQLFGKLLTLPMQYLDQKNRGDILSRVTTFGENLSEGIYQGILQLTSGVVSLTVTIVCMFMLNWIVSIVVICLTPLSALVAYFIAKRNRKTFKWQNALMSKMSSVSEEYLSGSRLVRVYGRKEQTQAEFDEINNELFKSGLASQFAGAMVNPVSRLVNNIVYAAVAICGCIIVANYVSGASGIVMTVGTLSAFLSYATQFAKPFNDITSVTAEMQTATAAAHKIFEIIDVADETTGGNLPISPPIDGIYINNGEFSYGGKPFITDLNFKIEKGQRVALVGSTGCGKTTVINIIMRFYDLDGGECIFDGNDIGAYLRRDVRQCFGMVLQDTWLFSGTIKENIAYGKSDATDDEIFAAAKMASLDGFIGTLEKGYDTIISGDAEQLSEGQKQLITIARIFLAGREMLIMDEATASVDTLTEKLVQKAFSQALKGKTTITVAHRLSTIKDYDLILVMDNGKIIEQGTHSELVNLNGYYCKMLRAAGGEV